jgi:hypothetical protein
MLATTNAGMVANAPTLRQLKRLQPDRIMGRPPRPDIADAARRCLQK